MEFVNFQFIHFLIYTFFKFYINYHLNYEWKIQNIEMAIKKKD